MMKVEYSDTLKLPLFTAYGVEIEYMIVDRSSLNILPITDKLFHKVAGSYDEEVNRGPITWSNEIMLHLIELKTSTPEKSLEGLQERFQQQVRDANSLLASFNAMLMPTAMHPWMNPQSEMQLWPHGNNTIYETFNRIFDCRGHGWSNLQSTHINLPFANDQEFAKLHAAIRVILPLLPAIAASSPVLENQATGFLDTRLEVYRTNSKKIPAITGLVIPEVVNTENEYNERILQPMYRAIAPYDPGNILQYEWLNSRGAITRFDRYTIEIRVLDVQECPQADLAVLHLTVALLKELVAERWAPISALNQLATEELHHLLLSSLKEGEQLKITNSAFLRLFGLDASSCSLQELWQQLYLSVLKDTIPSDPSLDKAIKLILSSGPLARRILKAVKDYKSTYGTLCQCLEKGELFSP